MSTVSRHSGINVFNDGIKYPFGTKQRALTRYIEYLAEQGVEHVSYIGPAFAVGGYAIAYACEQVGLPYKIYLVGTKHASQYKLLKHKRDIVLIKGNMRDAYVQEEAYIAKLNLRNERIPLGADNDLYIDLLTQSLAEDEELQELVNRSDHIWVAVGSGVILSVLMNIFPNKRFDAVSISNKYPAWIDRHPRVTHHRSRLRPTQTANAPYPTVGTYDAKVWEIAKDKAYNSDMIFNIAKGDSPLEPLAS